MSSLGHLCNSEARLYLPKGLLHWEVDADPAQRAHPSEWPRLSISADQGTDGLGAYHYLTRCRNLNLDVVWDFSHGVNNDLWLFLDGVSLRGLALQFLVSFNTLHGPWAEDARFQQCMLLLRDMFRSGSPSDNPLFQSFLPNMLRDPSGARHASAEDPLASMWSALADEGPWDRKGSKIVKSRFMGFVREARKEVSHYWARAYAWAHDKGFARIGRGEGHEVGEAQWDGARGADIRLRAERGALEGDPRVVRAPGGMAFGAEPHLEIYT